MPTRNVSLTDHLDQYVQEKIDSGRFSNASEVMREALRLLEQRDRAQDAKVERLRAAIQVGLDELERGEYIEIGSEDEMDAFFAEVHADVDRETAAQKKGSSRTRG